MWFERIEIKGFGRLRTDLEFSEGLSFVYGKNEAGKSTLFDALVCSLFGFSRADRRGSNSPQARRRPWSSPDQYGLQATFRGTSRGDRIRVEWDMRDHQVAVYDGVTGDNLTSQIGRAARDVDLGLWLLGIDRAEFIDVCCLDQVTIKQVHGSEGLKLALQESLASTPAEVGHEGAEELLRSFLRNELGLDLRGLRTKPDGPLGRLDASLADASEQLAHATANRAEIAGLASGLPTLRLDEQTATAEVRRLEQKLLLSQLTATNAILDRVKRREGEISRRPSEPRALATEPLERVRRDRERLADIETEIENLAERAETASADLTELKVRRDELVRERDALSTYQDVDSAAASEVHSLQAQREQVIERLAETGPAGTADFEVDPEVARFREQREELRQLSAGSGSPGAHLGVAITVAAVSLAAGILVSPIGLLGLAVAVAIYFYGSRAATSATGLEEALSSYGASSLEELEHRSDAEGERVSTARAETALRIEQRQADEAALQQIEAELRRLIDDAYPGGPGASLSERSEAYIIAAAKHERLTAVRAEVAEVESELQIRSEPKRQADDKTRTREGLLESLRTSYEQLGFEAHDLASAADALALAEAEVSADAEKLRVAIAAEQAMGELLGDKTVESLQRGAEEYEASLTTHRANYGQLADQAGDVEALQPQLDEARSWLAEARAAGQSLALEVERRDGEAGDPASLEARIADLEPRIARMQRAKDAIEIARGELEEAATDTYREFAPALQGALERQLPQVTAQRYSEAFIDEQLNIRVRAPETGEIVMTEQLSRGTQDQIFLIERLEIAKMLDRTTGGAPLLLDDPFDRFDLERLKLGLEIIKEVAQERQVILFSEDDHVVEAVKSVCAGCKLIELPPP